MKNEAAAVSDDEMSILLNELIEAYGYDFTNYAKASIKRRIDRLIAIDQLPGFATLLNKVKNDAGYLQHVIAELTVNVTEMFRDPETYKFIRQKLLPVLATHPFIRIWHAGCSSGEEVYSMAILLEEEKLLHKSMLYATDLNPFVIENIRKGLFPLNQMKLYSENYNLAGGKRDFSSYYTAKYNWAKFDEKLTSKMIAATHNLVSDRSFNEFQLIICRNVLIYFDKDLQDKALALFDESLEALGFLVLGAKENLRFTKVAGKYKQIENKEKIWRKVK